MTRYENSNVPPGTSADRQSQCVAVYCLSAQETPSVNVVIEAVCGHCCVTRDGGVREDAERPELNTTPC